MSNFGMPKQVVDLVITSLCLNWSLGQRLRADKFQNDLERCFVGAICVTNILLNDLKNIIGALDH